MSGQLGTAHEKSMETSSALPFQALQKQKEGLEAERQIDKVPSLPEQWGHFVPVHSVHTAASRMSNKLLELVTLNCSFNDCIDLDSMGLQLILLPSLFSSETLPGPRGTAG